MCIVADGITPPGCPGQTSDVPDRFLCRRKLALPADVFNHPCSTSSVGATRLVAHRAKHRCTFARSTGSAHFSVHLCRQKSALSVRRFQNTGSAPFRVHPRSFCRLKPALPVWSAHFNGNAPFRVHLLGTHPLGCMNVPAKAGAPRAANSQLAGSAHFSVHFRSFCRLKPALPVVAD